ncbi:hypothetical protein [Spartinivicinus ruber]|nr:hypothetical protein [Spartinivicinus ruber]
MTSKKTVTINTKETTQQTVTAYFQASKKHSKQPALKVNRNCCCME